MKATLIRVGIVVVATMVSGACAHRSPLGATAAATGYFATRLCGFDVDGKRNEVRYRIELAVIRPVPRMSVVEVRFENPLDSHAPLVTDTVLYGSERELRLISPPVKGLHAKPYEMLVRLYASSDKGRIIAAHRETCEAPFDQRDLGPQFQ